jgi:hypothetical protein
MSRLLGTSIRSAGSFSEAKGGAAPYLLVSLCPPRRVRKEQDDSDEKHSVRLIWTAEGPGMLYWGFNLSLGFQ